MSIGRRRVTVGGEVQGVGFRMNARAAALRLGLSGFARNLPDGSVEVEFEGPDDAIDEFIGWLSHGPRYASVESIQVAELEPTGADGFDLF
jgi:acylphosphatase